ncbi:MAG: PEGA domain-containing protein [Myxococcales bacterium]|nr:PEGA domain-containing protein [Myxococcales bacterium]
MTSRRGSGRSLCALALAVAVAASPVAAQPAPPAEPVPTDEVLPEEALTQRLALWRIDALGIDAELVGRLEALFRMELDRLATAPLPSRREIDKAIAGDRELGRCGGEDRCVAAIGKKLGVDVMITGSVAAMGDNYILNIKAVDVAKGTQIRRIATDPLRGSPDELIDAIRVAAYRLLAPDQLYGSVVVLTDLIGASVALDGKKIGATPLPGPVAKLPLGEHKLTVSAKGYTPFEEPVTVRFQKATRVVVRLTVAPGDPEGVAVPIVIERRPRPWYSSTWAYVGFGVAAVVAGVAIGYAATRPTEVDCSLMECR